MVKQPRTAQTFTLCGSGDTVADMNIWKRTGLPVVVVCLVALNACGNGDDDATDYEAGSTEGTGAPVQSTTSAPAPDSTDEAELPETEIPAEDVEIVADMVHERSAGWEDYEIVSETELRFLVTSGNQSCYGQRYQIEETEDEVAVAIIIGQRKEGAEICTQEAVFVAVPVELEEPLDQREVVGLQDPDLNS